MKKILYLTFYFKPDLSAGSFRNTSLVEELASQSYGKATLNVITTLPNRYGSFNTDAKSYEENMNYTVRRIYIPRHQSGMVDQIFSFREYFRQVRKSVRKETYDLVVVSSSRLFTAYLGYIIAKKKRIPLYLDVRDIFYDTLQDLIRNKVIRSIILPIVKVVEVKTFKYAHHINLISGGFRHYFERYGQANYTYFPNGVDDIFITSNESGPCLRNSSKQKQIVYAGNIGEGQGLHRIVPDVAKKLSESFKFLIIGDGGAKQKLIDAIKNRNINNVELRRPVRRTELIETYKNADFLFVHLNDYPAFRKVLPSKLFELGAFPKPLIAGVGGFAAEFVHENIENSILFTPCHSEELVEKIRNYKYKQQKRTTFIEKFKREAINKKMAASILKYI